MALASEREDSPAIDKPQPRPAEAPTLPVRWRDLPNKTQLFILALCRLSEPLSNVCLLPYLFYLVRSALTSGDSLKGGTNPPPTPDDISYTSGLLVASFPLAQFLVSLPWGWLSDHHGRRPSILLGLLVSAMANAAFGFSRSLGWLFFWRSVAGVANGNVGLMRTVTAELVTDRRLQTRAFLVLPLVFNSGMVASLALGGLLAEPVEKMPGLFGPDGILNWGGNEEGVVWMTRYPFALPALMNAFVLSIALVLAVLGLRETLVGKENEGRGLLSRHDNNINNRGIRYQLLSSGQQSEEAKRYSTAFHNTATPPPGRKETELSFRKIWTRRVVAAMVSFGLLPLHNSAFMHIFPIYLSTPRRGSGGEIDEQNANNAEEATTRTEALFTGGLALDARTIGLWLSLFGICGIALQLLAYPRLQSHLGGTLAVFRLSLLLFPAVYAAAPFLGALPADTVWQWLGLALVAGFQIGARTLAIPSTVVLLTEAAPSRAVLGTVHGAGGMLASLARAAGPAVGGWVFALGVRHEVIGAAWWFYLVPTALMALLWCFLAQRDE
ncbi:hypothetical protein M406DRAFT_52817 [Cryphonectria parasitica EP155]|uniref:Major facilitator superfamily (MFS) profile domain-containing protein n=1 Tax=Cryphonectria parasitica (strain ATCC 38755 / EP155) TaxID=660469 RepID=A0A9P4XUX2_CRYP1|nr:uncharacterized protein M406DRAFT_52817 [Cryphonectria parasitica EP155]KAF3761261.1 hypothetical protein M406DRAFT_52817 [Cryphonectria parasitica EP155]